MFDPMGLDSGMQTLLLMQIDQRLADLGRAQRGLPTLEEQRFIEQYLAQQEEEQQRHRPFGWRPGRGRR